MVDLLYDQGCMFVNSKKYERCCFRELYPIDKKHCFFNKNII